MEQLYFSLCANVVHCLVHLIFVWDFVVVQDILLVKFRLEIYLQKAILRQALISVGVHSKRILTLIIFIVKAYVYIGNMADLMFG